MQGTRALLALVIVMGVMIVLGTAGLVAVVVHRLTHAQPLMQAGPIVSGPPVSAFQGEPPGTRITTMVRQSDRLLAIALAGGGPDRILVWDLSAGRALTEIPLGH